MRVSALLALLVVAPSVGYCLDPSRAVTQYGLRHFMVEQGLPQNSVQAILQTRDGYLWLGTEEGLARFDGQRFQVFDKAREPAFKDNFVGALCEDHDGVLWIGTRDGLLRYRDGAFKRVELRGALTGEVSAIFEDSRRRLWIGAQDGLGRLEKDEMVIPAGLPLRPFVTEIAEVEGVLFFSTFKDGLIRIADSVQVLTTRDGLSSDRIGALRAGRDGRLWIGTESGVDYLEGGRIRPAPPAGRAIEGVTTLIEDQEGSLWVGTLRTAIHRLATDGRWDHYSAAQGLPGEIVLFMYGDREGSLWVGLNGRGLVQIRDVRFGAFGKQEGLVSEMALPILEDRSGNLWLGTYGGGLFRRKDGLFVGSELPARFIGSLAEYQGTLWVGSDGDGLYRIRGSKVTRFGRAEGLPSDRVIALLPSGEESIWVGTYDGGLSHYRDGVFTNFGRAEGLANLDIASLAEGGDGRLWVGTDGGGLYALEEGRLRAHTTEQGLANNTVHALLYASDGALWIATAGGLSRLKEGRFTAVTVAHGLHNDRIFQILEDGDRNLWVCSNKGISRVPLAELNAVADGKAATVNAVAYGLGDGMRAAECNGPGQPSGWRARDGTLWFPTPRGVVQVDPRRIIENEVPPPVVIELVRIDKGLYPTRPLDLAVPPGEGEIEIHYTGLSFLEPDKVRFKYRLVGFDRDWVDAGTRRVAYYTNIPPNRYRFEVIAANNDGVWSDTPATLEFELQPHFYVTGWFRGLMVLSLLGLGAAGYAWRVRRVVSQKRELEVLVERRTLELQDAKATLARVAEDQNRRAAIELIGCAWKGQTEGGHSESRTTAALAPTEVMPGAEELRLPTRYRPLRSLGRGGMGEVYLARDLELDELIAVKILRRDSRAGGEEELERFRREVKLARQVTHPCVVRTFELGDAEGRPFITMEYIDGPTLRDLVRASGALPVGVGALLCRQVAEGLGAAHRQGVLHRDVKPQNVLLSPRNAESKLSDFGIALRAEPERAGPRPIVGTPSLHGPGTGAWRGGDGQDRRVFTGRLDVRSLQRSPAFRGRGFRRPAAAAPRVGSPPPGRPERLAAYRSRHADRSLPGEAAG